MDLELKDKSVIVTGGGSNIGRAIVLAFAGEGAHITIGDVDTAQADKTAEFATKLGAASVQVIKTDVTSLEQVQAMFKAATDKHGRVDVLVNNAAIPAHRQIWHSSADGADEVMRVNFMSCVWTTFAALPPMLRQGGGTIVNVSSFAARVTPPREALYAASKAAMSSFSEGLWNDLAGSGIHVALIHPGPIDTEIWRKQHEPVAYDGPKYPPEIVADAILDAVEKRRHEVTVPRRNPRLVAARLLRLLAPALLRLGMRRMDPVPAEVVARARARSLAGMRLGEE